MLHKVNEGKATGLDNLPAKFLKSGATYLASPLAHVINLSIRQGTVPLDLKSARVIPLYKKKSKTDPGNYRPVSILSVLSKIFERVVYEQVEGHLTSRKLFFDFQFGFRSNFSTDSCLLHLSDHIKSQTDQGNLTGMVLLDLQKAFDTVDHSILIRKLEALGLCPSSIKWFRSYLEDRVQLVQLHDTLSTPNSVTCGVPQGSIMGPLLFLCYVNDMVAATGSKLMLYADDSAIITSGKHVDEIQNVLSNELGHIRDWLIDNKLSLHLGKTEAIIFGSKHNVKKTASLKIVCAGNQIESTKSVSYLGVTLDQTLSGSDNVKKALSKIQNKIKFLYRNTKGFDTQTKKLIVSALVQCHFDYGASFWYSGLTKLYKSKLQVMQNKVIRYILNLSPRSHIGAAEFQMVNMIPVEYRVQQLKLNHMFNVVNNRAPNLFSIAMVHNFQERVTRRSEHNVVIPRVKNVSSFRFTASKLWNNLPSDLQLTQSKYQFKRGVKKWLVDQYQTMYFSEFVYY